MLQLKKVSFSYLQKPTVKDISFSTEKGKIVAIIGESGCGKSTLLKLIYGLYDLNEGQIFWNEKEVLGPKYHLIPGMDYMKYLAQDFDLMPYITVAENVGKYLSNIYKDKKDQLLAPGRYPDLNQDVLWGRYRYRYRYRYGAMNSK